MNYATICFQIAAVNLSHHLLHSFSFPPPSSLSHTQTHPNILCSSTFGMRLMNGGWYTSHTHTCKHRTPIIKCFRHNIACNLERGRSKVKGSTIHAVYGWVYHILYLCVCVPVSTQMWGGVAGAINRSKAETIYSYHSKA